MEDTEIEIKDGKAEVTKTIIQVTIYELEELEHEVAAIQADIDKLEQKKREKQEIIDAFDK